MTIYDMPLHSQIELTIGSYTYIIIRVPGGWLYHIPRLDSKAMTCTFVPHDNEFKAKEAQ